VKIFKFILISLIFLSFNLETKEYDAKFGLITKLMKFVNFSTPPESNRIDTFGDAVFKDQIELKIKEGEKINGSIISGTVLKEVSEIKNSMIVFVPKKHSSELKEIIKYVSDKNIIVICEQKSGAQMGAIFNILIENNKLVFEVNKTEANKKGISINSRILQLAKKVF